MFKRELFGRFQGPQMGNLYEKVLALQQSSKVDCYREEFKALTAPLKNAYEEVLVGPFKNGLKPEIRAELYLFGLGSITELMGQAQRIEERNVMMSKAQNDMPQYQKTGSVSQWAQTKSGWVKPMDLENPTRMGNAIKTVESKVEESKSPLSFSSSASVQGKMSPTLKKLTEEEILKRREQGLCFKCDERFSPGHRCKNRLYHTMVLQEVDSDQETREEESREGDGSTKTEDAPIKLSMNSIVMLCQKPMACRPYQNRP